VPFNNPEEMERALKQKLPYDVDHYRSTAAGDHRKTSAKYNSDFL
jgi:hypothetical protein